MLRIPEVSTLRGTRSHQEHPCLPEASREQDDELLISQSLEGADG
jgi:hypothetical protein